MEFGFLLGNILIAFHFFLQAYSNFFLQNTQMFSFVIVVMMSTILQKQLQVFYCLKNP